MASISSRAQSVDREYCLPFDKRYAFGHLSDSVGDPGSHDGVCAANTIGIVVSACDRGCLVLYGSRLLCGFGSRPLDGSSGWCCFLGGHAVHLGRAVDLGLGRHFGFRTLEGREVVCASR